MNKTLIADGFTFSHSEGKFVYDDVLLPTDGSEASREAVEPAFDLAERYDATLHVLYVADTTEYSTVTFEHDVEDVLVEEGRRVTSELAERAEERGIDVVDMVSQGAPHEGIRDYVQFHDIDVVVMGTHGRSGLKRYLLGSVTERIVRDVDVPVIVVPAGEATEDSEQNIDQNATGV